MGDGGLKANGILKWVVYLGQKFGKRMEGRKATLSFVKGILQKFTSKAVEESTSYLM